MIFFFVFLVLANSLSALPLIVGICGGSGSGKTTLAHSLKSKLGDEICVILSQDNYYKSEEDLPLPHNFDEPDSIDFALFQEHIRLLKSGVSVQMPQYDFTTNKRIFSEEWVHPKKVILVEGFLLFLFPEIRSLFDLKFFLDLSEDLLFIRQLDRDLQERGRSYVSVRQNYLNYVRPAYLRYVLPLKQYADFIIPMESPDVLVQERLLRFIKNDL